MGSGIEKITKTELGGNYYTNLVHTNVSYRYGGITDSYVPLPNVKPSSIKILSEGLAYAPEQKILYCRQFVCLTNYSFDNFRALDNTLYITNDEQVFFYSDWNAQPKYALIPGLNPQDFSIIGGLARYVTDGKTIFFEGNPIHNADVNTFELIEEGTFSYDRDTVFFLGKPTDINPRGFTSINGKFYKNGQSIYCADTVGSRYVELKANIANFKEFPEYEHVYGDGQYFYNDRCASTHPQGLRL